MRMCLPGEFESHWALSKTAPPDYSLGVCPCIPETKRATAPSVLSRSRITSCVPSRISHGGLGLRVLPQTWIRLLPEYRIIPAGTRLHQRHPLLGSASTASALHVPSNGVEPILTIQDSDTADCAKQRHRSRGETPR